MDTKTDEELIRQARAEGQIIEFQGRPVVLSGGKIELARQLADRLVSYKEKWSYLYNELTKLCVEAKRAGHGFREYPDLHGFHTVLRMMEQADGFTFGEHDR